MQHNFILTDVMKTGDHHSYEQFIDTHSLSDQNFEYTGEYYTLHKYDLEKYDRTPVVADDGTAAEADVYMKNDQMKTCTATDADCSSVSAANDVEYDQGIGSSTHQSTHAEGDTSDDHILVYTLATPYTVALISPTVDISFGTQNAIKAAEVGTDLCMFEPQEPIVKITIK